MVEDHGSAPRLVAWVWFLALAAFLLSLATFNGGRCVVRGFQEDDGN